MSASPEAVVLEGLHDTVRRRFAETIAVSEQSFATQARAVAQTAHAMAERFFVGGRLLVFAYGVAATDAQHNAVEYVHPVLPGCRALPAIALTNDIATVSGILLGPDPAAVFEHQVNLLGRPQDIALAFADIPVAPCVARGLEAARRRGMLRVALLGGATEAPELADHQLTVRCRDGMLAQEVHLATYHMLWELVHIVLNHRGIPERPLGGEVTGA